MVEDVSWNMKDENIFGSVGDDFKLVIWDLRTNKPQQSVKPHDNEVIYLLRNPCWVFCSSSVKTLLILKCFQDQNCDL